jgi:hypothetical protein
VSESQVSAAGGDDNQIHNDEHSVVTPAVGPRFAPEAGVPSKYFLLYGANHNQNQTDGGELCENARNYSEAASYCNSAAPRKIVTLLLIPMSLLRVRGSLRCL